MKTVEEKLKDRIDELNGILSTVKRHNEDEDGKRISEIMALRHKVSAIEAKNAALVAALESLKRAVGYKPRRHGEIVLYRNDLGVFIDNAIAANEKGGANG